MFEDYEDIITVEELCSMLKCGRNAAYQFLATGKIKAINNGKKYIIPKQSVIDFIHREINRGQNP